MSPYADRFILKGAALFTLWTGIPHRTTRDVDLLGFGDPDPRNVKGLIAEILAIKVEDDGFTFDLESLTAGLIREDQAYGGIRVTAVAHIGGARIRLQIDVGFGDAITPEPGKVEFPTLLEFPAPVLLAYERETVVAEKLEAMVQLGQANTRMKDFFDLHVLSRDFEFDGDVLVEAIRATFERRSTPIPGSTPVALTPEFSEDPAKTMQWNAFVRKSGAPRIGEFSDVMKFVATFVEEPLHRASQSEGFDRHWSPPGPWR